MTRVHGKAKWTVDENALVDEAAWALALAAALEGRERDTLQYLKKHGGEARQGDLFDCARGRTRGAEGINRSLKNANVNLRLVLCGRGRLVNRPWRLMRIQNT